MQIFEALLILVTLCVALVALAQRLNLPESAVLIVAGGALAFVPGVPTPHLQPELVLALFLPPLLQASAYRTDWASFRANLRPIAELAFAAVLFTTLIVALVAKLLVPAMPWWAAVALGAIVSPPDAVAAKTVLKTIPLPKRLVVVLEGESMMNDATSLVLYRFAVAAIVGGAVTVGGAIGTFVVAAAGGAIVGWLVGRAAMLVFARLADNQLVLAVSFLASFAAYLAAEWLHGSGVLAAVACGLVLARQQRHAFSSETRLSANAVWTFVEFLLESLVFILMGLQLRGVVANLANIGAPTLAGLAVALAAALIGSRFVWMFAAAGVGRLLRRAEPLPWSHATVLSWAGMRGIIGLAAALALPAAFPFRDLIIFLAYCATLATLVVQGTTLAWVIRRLGLAEPENAAPDPALAAVRAEAADAAHAAVEARTGSSEPGERAAAEEVAGELAGRAERLRAVDADAAAHEDMLVPQIRLRLAAVAAARDHLVEQRDTIDADAATTVTEELDLEEERLRRILGDTDPAAS